MLRLYKALNIISDDGTLYLHWRL